VDDQLEEIRKIIELMEEHDLSFVNIEREGVKIKLKRGMDADAVQRLLAAAPPVAAAAPPAPTLGTHETPVAAGNEIPAPMVGTFYRAASPDSEPFIQIGSVIDEDSAVCIIEAMKVMNEIKAETRGVITHILVDDASPVQFGEPLFRVEPA
jgi:acetyl-CoA carboxylase biotin carboxyl carrier protein